MLVPAPLDVPDDCGLLLATRRPGTPTADPVISFGTRLVTAPVRLLNGRDSKTVRDAKQQTSFKGSPANTTPASLPTRGRNASTGAESQKNRFLSTTWRSFQ